MTRGEIYFDAGRGPAITMKSRRGMPLPALISLFAFSMRFLKADVMIFFPFLCVMSRLYLITRKPAQVSSLRTSARSR